MERSSRYEPVPVGSVRYTVDTTLEILLGQLQENNTVVSNKGPVRVRTYDGEFFYSARSALLHEDTERQMANIPTKVIFSGVVEKDRVSTEEGMDFNSAMECIQSPLPVDTVVLVNGTYNEPTLRDITEEVLNPSRHKTT